MRDTSPRPRRLGGPAVCAAVLACAFTAAVGTRSLAQENRDPGERFTATAINIGTPRAAVDRIEIVVTQLSPRAQRDRLLGVLFEKGPEKLLDVLRIDREGRGEGKMSIATRITADKKNNTVELENWGTQPVMLKDVRRERG